MGPFHTVPDVSRWLQVGSVRPTLERQIFINDFHKSCSNKSWCWLAAQRSPRVSHPWTYRAWEGRELSSFTDSGARLEKEGYSSCSRLSSHGSAKLAVKLKSSL